MSVTITIDGFDRLLAVVSPARATAEMDKAVQRSAQMVRDETKKMPPVNKLRSGWNAPGIPVAPKHGGTLRQSVAARRVALMAADVFTNPSIASYGPHVHGGTSKMPGRPFLTWQLEEFGGLEKIEVILTDALRRIASP